jgi:hypothetical protein
MRRSFALRAAQPHDAMTMLDTREYEDFIVPVWEPEAARDTGEDAEPVLRMLGRAAALNARTINSGVRHP